MSSAAAFNAMGELFLLGRSGTVAFLDFSILKVMVSGSALQLETCYSVVALPCPLSAKTYLSAKTRSFFCSCGTLLQQAYQEGLVTLYILHVHLTKERGKNPVGKSSLNGQ